MDIIGDVARDGEGHVVTAAGELLRRARRAAGLSQAFIAAKAGTTQAVVSRIESGRSVPELPTLSRLLLACGASLQLTLVPYSPVEQRQLDESLELTPQERADRNRRQTALAERGATAHRQGRVRRLTVPRDDG